MARARTTNVQRASARPPPAAAGLKRSPPRLLHHRRRGPGPAPAPASLQPSTSPRTVPRISVPCAEWSRRASTSATPRLLASPSSSPAQKSASAGSRSIVLPTSVRGTCGCGLLYARRRGQADWDAGFADRIETQPYVRPTSPSPLTLHRHPSGEGSTLTLNPHPSSPLTQPPGSKYGLHPSTLTPQPSTLKLPPRHLSPFSPRVISL